jgi:hypothetical protein
MENKKKPQAFNTSRGTNSIDRKMMEFSGDVPDYSEKVDPAKGIVKFGDDNKYPDFLLGLLSRSSTHRAIVSTKAQLIGGNGIVKEGLSNDALMFIANPWNEYDLEEIVARISLDLEIYGAFALNIIWTKDRKKISQINYMNPQTIRIIAPDDNEESIQGYIVNKSWKKYLEKNSVAYPGFSKIDIKNPSQILYVKKHQSGKYYYGEPNYVSNVKSIMCDYSIANYHYNNIENGFSLQTVFNWVGYIPGEEEKDFLISSLQNQHQGSDNPSNTLHTFSNSKDEVPVITTMNTNQNGENFLNLDEKIVNKIMVAHQVTNPTLFGVVAPGGLASNKNELVESLKTFQALYVTPQQNLIEKVLNRLARVNGVTDNIELAKYELDVQVNITVPDLLAILSAQITPSQKTAVLVASGYSEDEAKNMVGNGIEPAPGAAPVKPKPAAVAKQSREKFQAFKQDAKDAVEAIKYKQKHGTN